MTSTAQGSLEQKGVDAKKTHRKELNMWNLCELPSLLFKVMCLFSS